MWGINVARVEAIESEWQQAHRELSRLARQRAAADAEEGRWLLAAARSAAHLHLGFGSFVEYIERLFGYGARSTQEKLRVAEALEALPVIASALDGGTLSWSAVRELTRVAVADTERDWLELARGKTIRQLEELVAGARPGDAPDAPRDPSARRHVLRFEVTAEAFALVREAIAHLRRTSDARLDDDSALLAMARAVLGGPRDDGRSSYQIALSICTECGHGAQPANGTTVVVSPEIVAMADCDGQQLGPITPANDSAHGGATNQAEPTNTHAHVGARAKQSIPPAVRRAVLHRDQHRCRVPGCKNATFLDVHHIEARADGGRNDAENLVTLCGMHHRAAHRGQLVLEGAGTSVRFRHADGSAYGAVADPRALDVQAKVFTALRILGFREGEVRVALAELRTQSASCELTAERLLREALVRLTWKGHNR
jgi:HNH endonuclease